MLRKLGQLFVGHPLIKALALAVAGIAANVLSGAYVFDITKTDPATGPFIDWAASPQSRYFWWLAGLAIVTGVYGWAGVRSETRVRRALVQEALRQRALEVLVEPTLESVKKEIEQGRLIPMGEVFRLLGADKDKRR